MLGKFAQTRREFMIGFCVFHSPNRPLNARTFFGIETSEQVLTAYCGGDGDGAH